MAKQLQFRRGTTAENNAFKGAPGELTYDIERKELRVHDGVTLGGKPIETSANLVHTIGNETINGTKTFKSALHIYDTTKDIATTPTTNRYWGGVEFRDTNGTTTGYIRSNHYTSGRLITDIQTARNIDGTTKYASIGVAIDSDGTVVTDCPTPPSTSNGTQIATTAWVNTAAVHKTGNETISGVKTFTDYIKASAGVGVQIGATSHSFNLRSSGATPEGCGLFVDNNTAKTAFNVTDTKITIGSTAIVPHSVTPASNSNSTNIATTAFVKSVLSSSGNGLATFNKGGNGYYKFSNGLIIQWGRIQYPSSTTTSSNLTLTFPTPFSSNSSYSVTATSRSSSDTNYARGHTSITSPTASTVDFRLSNAEYTTGGWVFWTAIGY